MNYKGFEIEPWEGRESGKTTYVKTDRSRHKIAQTRTRKVKYYLIHYPDSDATKLLPTLRDAKAYIDGYCGD